MKHQTFLHAVLFSVGMLSTSCVTGEEADTAISELRRGSKDGCLSNYAWLGMLANFNTCGSTAVLSSLPAEGGAANLSLPKVFADGGTVEFRLSLPPGSEDDTLFVYLYGNANDGPHGLTLKYEQGNDGIAVAVLSVFQGNHVVDLAWSAHDGDSLRWQIADGVPAIWLNGRLIGRLDENVKFAPLTPYDFIVGVSDNDASGSALGMGIVGFDVYEAPTSGGVDL